MEVDTTAALGGGDVTLLELTGAYATLANGGVRLEQEVTLTRYTVQLLSGHNFRILNLPVGAIPAATYPCYEVSPAVNGNRVFQDNIKIFKLTKVQ